MASLVDGSVFGGEDDSARAQKLANARKKLKSFRATRSTDNSLSAPPAASSRSTPPTSLSIPIPLVTDITGNGRFSPLPGPSKGGEMTADIIQPFSRSPRSPGKLRKSRSKGSISHRRQNSSISGTAFHRGSAISLFEDDGDLHPVRGELPRPSEIIATPATPLMPDASEVGGSLEENREVVRERLSTFSFGAKRPATSRSPSPRDRIGQPLLPSQVVSLDVNTSPIPSPSKRLSTPLSRPPSLLLTRPTPIAFGSPSPSGARQMECPQTPPTPAKTKRHSHTRSNSISLPNLKLSSRPASLGVSNPPSFPSSPSSPMGAARPNTLYQGTRLKFEPSGRGAEAEKEKEEYRRKALEKLTGSPSPIYPESPSAEIALPDLDDEDGSSVASSARPFSGFGSFTFGRPNSSSSTPSGFSWTTSEESPPLEKWSTGSNAKQDDNQDALGFGFTFSGNGSGSFSFGAAPPPVSTEFSIGMGLPSIVPARPSLTRNLSVLAEVDEPEEGESVAETDVQDVFVRSLSDQHMPMSPFEEEMTTDTVDTTHFARVVAPAPTRLRELHLVSSVNTPVSARAPLPITATSQGSPTKGYGAIGRGRPAPLAHIDTDSPVSLASLISTPKSATGPRRRPAPGSRGSSISYKKDGDSDTSSRDWSFSGINPLSPPSTLTELGSPPAAMPHFSGWTNTARSGSSRPCPRPKSLAGLGFDHQGAGRVLGELEEVDEDALSSSRNTSFRLTSAASSMEPAESVRDSLGDYAWRDMQLELEMERDALREDVDLWRVRCTGLEDKLEAEKKENAILRDRVRKLGDRLSSVSSYPVTNNRDTSLVADLRTQLFGFQVELDRERTQRLAAQDRMEELQAQLAEMTMVKNLSPPVKTNVIPPTPSSPNAHFTYPSPALTNSTSSPSPDPTSRIRGWGFPKGPVAPAHPKNRESFFGLSQVLRRDSVEEERQHGIDLPPITLPLPSAEVEDDRYRAVSDPTPKAQHRALEVDSEESQRSTSLTSSASSALSFFADYLPKYARPTSPARQRSLSPEVASRSSREGSIKRLPNSVDKGHVDLRHGCKCCVGDVIDL